MHAYWGRGFEILDNHHIHSFLHLPFKQEAVLYGNLDPKYKMCTSQTLVQVRNYFIGT